MKTENKLSTRGARWKQNNDYDHFKFLFTVIINKLYLEIFIKT